MRRLLWLIPILCCSQAWATFTCQDGSTLCTSTTTRSCATAGTSCNITVASTTGGSIGVIAGQTASTTVTVTGSGGGTWTSSTNSHGTDTNGGGTENSYNLNMTASTTTVTCTFSASNASNQCLYFNFTGTLGTYTFDTGAAANHDTTSCSTSCAGVGMTLSTANNYILIQSSACSNACSAIDQSYNAVFLAGDGFGYKLNVSTIGTTPNWTQPGGSNSLAGGAIAIYETSGAVHTAMPVVM